MGVDVQLYVEITDPSPELLEVANRLFDSVCNLGDRLEAQDKPTLQYHKGYGHEDMKEYGWCPNRIKVETLARYYGGGSYHHESWPEILKGILALRTIFPGAVVCYGGDGLEYSEPVTEEMVKRLQTDYMHASKMVVSKEKVSLPMGCDEIKKREGFTVACCEGCHEDHSVLGEPMIFLSDDNAEVCCAVFNAIEEKKERENGTASDTSI